MLGIFAIWLNDKAHRPVGLGRSLQERIDGYNILPVIVRHRAQIRMEKIVPYPG